MKRNDLVRRNGKNRLAQSSTDRRTFLADAGKYGAALLGAAGLAGRSALDTAYAQGADAYTEPVAQKNVVRVMGLTQRRSGLTRKEAPLADTPHFINAYYGKVYNELTKKRPGRNVHALLNVVTDSAFGGDRTGEYRLATASGANNLHFERPPEMLPCTTFANRDMVSEIMFDAAEGKAPAAGRKPGEYASWAPNMPQWIEAGTEMNIVMQQVFAHGVRPVLPTAGSQKAIYFLKLAKPGAADAQLKQWQELHAAAIKAMPAFGESLLGYELLARIPDVAPRQPNRCGPELPLPDLAATYWTKDAAGVVNTFPDFARAFRKADTGNALDIPASFFVLVEEFEF